MIKEIEQLPVEAQGEPFIQTRFLERGEIEAGLKAPAEDISTVAAVTSLKGIASRYAHLARLNEWHSKRGDVDVGRTGARWLRASRTAARRHLLGRSHRLAGQQRNDGIVDEIICSVINARNAASKVIDAVWLAALRNADPTNDPAICQFRCQAFCGAEFRKFILVRDGENVGAIEVGGGIR